AGGGVTQIEPSKKPVTLVPHVSRNWIIAVAPAELMPQIKAWITELDRPREADRDYELYEVQHADTADLAQEIERAVQSCPNLELRESTHVVPFGQSKKLIVFGSKKGREMVKDLLARLDVEDAAGRSRRTFPLKHADAEEMAERIEDLFSRMELDYKYESGYGYTSSQYRRDSKAPKVTVVPDTRRNAITVITDPETMKEVVQLIEEEDAPLELGDVKPRIYELKHVDPGEIQELLNSLFSDSDSGGDSDFMRYYFGYSRSSSGKKSTKAVGRLKDQFTFQVLPSAGTLIVTSRSPDNFRIIDELIAELDKPQLAGLPMIVELNHANAEDLCEQLNAILAESGTLAKIQRADRGLSDIRPTGAAAEAAAKGGPSPAPDQPKAAGPGEMGFWWQGFKPPQGQIPHSNLVGKIRIVPVYRRNALMVMSPEGYKEPVREMITSLDQPSRQVMICARIGEIQHDEQTTLGLRIASDATMLSPADTSLGGSGSAVYTEPFFGGTLVVSARANVADLINALMKTYGMKILLEPTLTTSDNKASEYFDGQDLSVQTERRTSAEGTATVTGLKDVQVGTRLRVRPHITKNGNVDLLINLEISRMVPGSAVQGNPVFDRREVTTHVIVAAGQTIMLSGIIRQEDFSDVRRVPLLGDLPLLGPLFRSVDKGTRNRELVVFITPQVMNTPEDVDARMVKPAAALKRIEDEFSGEGEGNGKGNGDGDGKGAGKIEEDGGR
ncbi:MAG TPA: secretin N-terminal domain-containing protein, partial [Phycisphaerae bacterium]|nr:secretin N-terminal domain-containing protein [Phycisphaerae bacterium]